MKIDIVCVGKLKEKYLVQAIDEYSKRLSRYCKLNIIELADEKTPDNASEKEELQIKDKEGDKILAQIKDTAYVITLDLGGKMVTSEAFAQMISNCGIQGNSHLVFVIGGSLGLADKVLKRQTEAYLFLR